MKPQGQNQCLCIIMTVLTFTGRDMDEPPWCSVRGSLFMKYGGFMKNDEKDEVKHLSEVINISSYTVFNLCTKRLNYC